MHTKSLLFVATLWLCAVKALAQDNAQVQPKLSPTTQQYLYELKKAHGQQPADYVYCKTAEGLSVKGMIKASPSLSQSVLEAAGIHVGTKAGNIWTVQVPVNKIDAFTHLSGISYIDLDAPVAPLLDSVRRVTHVDSVHAGIGLSMPYTGKGVVVGIVDAGFDFTHPTFYDTLGTNYRVKQVWEQKTTTGTPPAAFSYGTELTDPTAIKAAHTDQVYMSHGTHVAGIAGGSGFGSSTDNRRYRGIAFEGDIVLACIMPDSGEAINTGLSDMVDGVNYVFSYGTSAGEPAIANLSWGNGLGPHNGTSLFSQAIDALTGTGKIFICAAGNDGTDLIHLSKTFTETDSALRTFVAFASNISPKITSIDAWGDTGKTFCVNVSLYDKVSGNLITSSGNICLDDTSHIVSLVDSMNDTCTVHITTSASEFNNKPRAFMKFYNYTNDSVSISVVGTDGTVNMWDAGYVHMGEGYISTFTNGGQPWATVGNVITSVSDLSSTASSVCAAAFNSKESFTNINSESLYFPGESWGSLASFSSHGPTADGRIKPDIAAPGLTVASAVSSYDTTFGPGTENYQSVVDTFHYGATGRNYYYAVLSGTSMASPATAGIIALMLQANPTLTPDQVKDILAATAMHDVHTGIIPAEGKTTWGHGKINAYQAVRRAASMLSVSSVTGNAPDCVIFPNPNNGSFTLDYTGTQGQQLTVDIYDVTGRTVAHTKWMVNTGDNRKEFNCSKLQKGNYFTRVTSAEGCTTLKTTIY